MLIISYLIALIVGGVISLRYGKIFKKEVNEQEHVSRTRWLIFLVIDMLVWSGQSIFVCVFLAWKHATHGIVIEATHEIFALVPFCLNLLCLWYYSLKNKVPPQPVLFF